MLKTDDFGALQNTPNHVLSRCILFDPRMCSARISSTLISGTLIPLRQRNFWISEAMKLLREVRRPLPVLALLRRTRARVYF